MSAKVGRPQQRPTTSYGRRDSSANSPEKYPRRVEELVEKKIASEYHFNKQAKLRRINSELTTTVDDGHRLSASNASKDFNKQRRRTVASSTRHRGDENLSENDLALSLPATLSKLSVGGVSDKRRRWSPGGYSDSDSSDDEDRKLTPNDRSPVMIRNQRTSVSCSRSMTFGGGKNDSNGKLGMMKKKLSPLPSRQRIKHLSGSSYDETTQ